MQPQTPIGSFTTSASWLDSIGGITRPGEVPPHLGVVVECGGGPAHLVRVLDERLAALLRHDARQLVGAGAQPRRDLVQQLGALDRRESPPRPGTPPRRPRSPRRAAPPTAARPTRSSPRWPGSPPRAARRRPRPARRGSAAASPFARTLAARERGPATRSTARWIVSGSVKMSPSLPSPLGTPKRSASSSSAARSLACAAWPSSTSPPPSVQGADATSGGSGSSGASKFGCSQFMLRPMLRAADSRRFRSPEPEAVRDQLDDRLEARTGRGAADVERRASARVRRDGDAPGCGSPSGRSPGRCSRWRGRRARCGGRTWSKKPPHSS